MRAYFKTRPDLVISIFFHLIVFLGILLFFLIKSCSKEESVYVFEMVDTSDQLLVDSKAESKPKLQSSILKKKETAPIKRMDYEQFLKENGKPKYNPQTATASTQNEVKLLPKFEVQVDSQVEVKPNQSLQASVLQEYGRYVYKQISAQWDKPSANSGNNLSVKVQFALLPNGQIQSVKIVQSSGNLIFDQSVLNVFKNISKFKPTPSSQRETFIMNFRLKDSADGISNL